MAENHIVPSQLVLPLFVREGISEPQSITSMPGQSQHTLDSLRRVATEAAEAGVGGVMLFGVPATRDAVGSGADDPEGILNVATTALQQEVGDVLVVQTDLCLDEFTDHGHCGVLRADGAVDNDATLERYVSMGIAQARAGSQLLGLSGMMDGQVAAIRSGLDAEGFTDTIIMAYSAKYAGAFYGPFREAVDSQLKGDRRTYQMDPPNAREGVREARPALPRRARRGARRRRRSGLGLPGLGRVLDGRGGRRARLDRSPRDDPRFAHRLRPCGRRRRAHLLGDGSRRLDPRGTVRGCSLSRRRPGRVAHRR
jgi:delta-aminolevulinic acid dehydratase/porphobilinogen synthase